MSALVAAVAVLGAALGGLATWACWDARRQQQRHRMYAGRCERPIHVEVWVPRGVLRDDPHFDAPLTDGERQAWAEIEERWR